MSQFNQAYFVALTNRIMIFLKNWLSSFITVVVTCISVFDKEVCTPIARSSTTYGGLVSIALFMAVVFGLSWIWVPAIAVYSFILTVGMHAGFIKVQPASA